MFVNPTKETFSAFSENDRGGPIHMLNLVRLRERAAYPHRLRSGIENAAKKQNIPFEQARAARMATTPAKRFGTTEEFGAACAFLCSSQAGFITGQNLLLDGGAIPTAF